jgi:hypothetical protein
VALLVRAPVVCAHERDGPLIHGLELRGLKKHPDYDDD